MCAIKPCPFGVHCSSCYWVRVEGRCAHPKGPYTRRTGSMVIKECITPENQVSRVKDWI